MKQTIDLNYRCSVIAGLSDVRDVEPLSAVTSYVLGYRCGLQPLSAWSRSISNLLWNQIVFDQTSGHNDTTI